MADLFDDVPETKSSGFFDDVPDLKPRGQIEGGNIDLHKRPVVKNDDGSISTVRSITVGFDDGTYVLPTVSPDGKILSDKDAIELFKKDRQHLGKFKSRGDADAYAERLHEDQAKEYGPKEPSGFFDDVPDLPKAASAEDKARLMRPSMMGDMGTESLGQQKQEYEQPDMTPSKDSWRDLGEKVLNRVVPLLQQTGAGMVSYLGRTAPPVTNMGIVTDGEALRQRLVDMPQAMRKSADVEGSLANIGQRLYREAEADLQANAPDVVRGSLKDYTFQAVESTIQMIPAFAASLATGSPAPGMAVMGTQVFGQKVGESLEAGRPIEAATLDAAFFAAAEAIPEKFPLEILIKPGGKFMGRTLKAMGSEALQEMFTQVLQTGYDAGVIGVDMTWGEALRQIRDAGIIGGLVGGGLSVGSQPIHAARERADMLRTEPGLVDEYIVNRERQTRGESPYNPNLAPTDPRQGEPSLTVTPPPAAVPPGLLERVQASPIPLNDGDVASPIDTGIIAEGKGLMAESLAGQKADEILAANGWPGVGQRVTVDRGRGPEGGTVRDAFETSIEETGAKGQGIKIDLDNGTSFEELADQLRRAGVRITPEQAAQAAAAVAPPSAPGGLLDEPLTNPTAAASDYDRAVAFARERPSTSYIQRKMGLPYDQAAALMARMEQEGVVSPMDAKGNRTILTGDQPAPAAKGDGSRSAPVLVEHRDHVDVAADRANRTPTDAQKEAGNYEMGHMRLHGLEITIETPRGAERSGVGADGQSWAVNMPEHYGYIRRTTGADGEQVDAYIGRAPESTTVFVIDQKNDNGAFDEHKVMLGFPAKNAAIAAYNAAFSDGRGPERMGAIHEMSIEDFKAHLETGDYTQPLANQQMRMSQKPAADAADETTDRLARDVAELSALHKEQGRDAANARFKELQGGAGNLTGYGAQLRTAFQNALEGNTGIRVQKITQGRGKGQFRAQIMDGPGKGYVGVRSTGAEALADAEKYREQFKPSPQPAPVADTSSQPQKGGVSASELAEAWAEQIESQQGNRPSPGAIAKAGAAIHDAINNGEWSEYFSPQNKAARAIYERYVGVKLPRGEAETRAVIESKSWQGDKTPAKSETVAPAPAQPRKRDYPSYTTDELRQALKDTERQPDKYGPEIVARMRAEIEARDNGTSKHKVTPQIGPGWVDGKKVENGRIGENARGKPLFEDERGVRSYSDSGIRISETVGFIPGGGISINRAERGRDFSTAEEYAEAQGEADKAKKGDAIAKAASYGASNTLFTQEERAAAAARIRNRLKNQSNVGLDPEMLKDGIAVAGYHIEAGARSFAAYAKAMVEDLGEGIRPYLKSWYNAVRDWPGFDAEGMTPYADITPEMVESAGKDDGVQGSVSGSDEGAGSRDVQRAPQEREDGRAPAGEGDAGQDDVSGLDGEAGQAAERLPSGRAGGKRGGAASAGNADRVPAADRADAGVTGQNYIIEPGALQEARSFRQKARDNIRAIELMRTIEAEARPATKAEQEQLAMYVGWGGIKGAFPDGNEKFAQGFEEIGERLKTLLSPTEYKTARRTIQYAHYTAETIVREMWRAAERLGFTGGLVFEPGMGVGNFAGMMPPDIATATQYSGLELDPTTARIARLLYPQSGVRNDDFTKAPLPRDTYDLVIGNPPFGDIPIKTDPAYKQGFLIHDYFFAKSLDAVRPGGILAFVTSAGTLNKLDTKAREYFADRAEFVGAIRLPGDAFAENAGTQVTTDIIFLRKLLPGEDPASTSWTQTGEVTLPNKDGAKQAGNMSQYFIDNPGMVLGEQGFFDKLIPGRYGVRSDGRDFAGALAAAVDKLPTGVMRPWESVQGDRTASDFGSKEKKEGSFYFKDGELMQQRGGVGQPVAKRGAGVEGGKTTGEVQRIKKLVPIRDALRAVYDADLRGDTAASEAARKTLNSAYDAFVELYGPINKAEFQYRRPTIIQQESARLEAREEARFNVNYFDDGEFNVEPYLRKKAKLGEIAQARQAAREEAVKAGRQFDEGTFNPDDMADVVIDRRPNVGAFMDDPESYRLRSIEKYDEVTDKAEKGRVFFENIISKELVPEIKGVGDALLYVLNQKGRLDIGAVAQAAGLSEAEAIEQLGEQIFQVPGTEGTWATAEHYLSGNVRQKLREAQAAAESNPAMARNVEALKAVQPAPLPPSEIAASLGMPWIPTDVIEAFAKDGLGLERAKVSYLPALAQWSVQGDGYSAASTSTWGTSDRSADKLLLDALNRQDPKIYDTIRVDGKNKQVINPAATQAVQDKVREIKAKFQDWVYTDEARTDRLVNLYNENYNNLVVPNYSGDYLTTPGIATNWKWRPHQTRVIARIIQGGNTYMAHAVGAGKTSAMIATGMELRRLGLARKPMYVVPNHMLGQFTKEFYEQYPTARIMVADEKRFHTDTRKQFISDVANEDLDAVILTHSAFGKIPVSAEFQDGLIQEQLDQYRDLLAELGKDPDNRVTRGKVEAAIEKMEQRLGGKAKKQDQTFTFEEMGVDHLFVDEAHLFRKLDFATKMSNVKGISSEGSKASWDLYVKTRYLETKNPGHNLVLASGTPITNTMAELYTVSRYLQPKELEARGLAHFDAWAAAYGDTAAELEQNAAGGYKPVTRFAKFVNIPELSAMVRLNMDVVTSKQLEQYVTRPAIEGGTRKLIVVEKSDSLEEYQGDLARRMTAIEKRKGPPQKGDDIMLTVINDGRHAAIDMRLIHSQLRSDPGSKLNKLVDGLFEEWETTKNQPFYKPKPGGGYEDEPFMHGPATQMVFANLGIGDGRPFNVQKYIVSEMVRRGVPRDQIAIISDYKSHTARQRLFNDVNDGKVRILIGSTAKMATGVNAQRRLSAIHNLDPLWYPADDEQRIGRGLRQGNLNRLLKIRDYSTKGTYDSTMWGMMERKARFIQGFFEGDPSIRDMEDLGEASQYEQAKAITTNDPRLITLTEYKQDLEKERRRQAGFEREQYALRSKVANAKDDVERIGRRLAAIEKDLAIVQDTSGDLFTATLGDETFDERKAFGEALIKRLEELVKAGIEQKQVKIAKLGGFDLAAKIYKDRTGKELFYGLDLLRSDKYSNDIAVSNSPLGIVRSIETILRNLPEARDQAERGIADAQQEIEAFTPKLGAKFTGGDRIRDLAEKVAAIEAQFASEAAAAKATMEAQAPEEEGDAPKASRFGMGDQTETEAFKAWFGDSKVVDASGKPMVMYHATEADISAFDMSKSWRSTMFFAKTPEGARKGSTQGSTTIYPVYIRAEKIKGSPTGGQYFGKLDSAATREKLQAEGYDGVWVRDEGGTSLAVFDPTQIKSATGNTGAFDPADPDIRYARTMDRPFYSALTWGIESLTQTRASASAWTGTIDNLKGVKAEEIEWSGVKEWLGEQEGAVSKDALLEYLRANEITLKEITYSDSNAPAVDPRNEVPELGPMASEWMEERIERADAAGGSTLTPSEQRLYDWLDANPGASDMEYLTREYDIWLDEHPGYDRTSAGDLRLDLQEIYHRESPNSNNRESLGADIQWLDDFIDRWEMMERGDVTLGGGQQVGRPRYASYKLPGGANYREMLLTLPRMPERHGENRVYMSGHWDEPNILAHVRFDDRTGPNGERVLHIAEIQSDWHQQGRKLGYKDRAAEAAAKAEVDRTVEAFKETMQSLDMLGFETMTEAYNGLATHADWRDRWDVPPVDQDAIENYLIARNRMAQTKKGVADAPFKTTWQELAFKRMLRFAAQNGYDSISWDTGETNANRYSLEKHITELRVRKGNGDYFHLSAVNRGATINVGSGSAAEIADIIGQEMAARIATDMAEANPDTSRSYTGLDLRVGGEGMRGFYDGILPKFVAKYVKKWGAKVERGTVAADMPSNIRRLEGQPVATTAPAHTVTITPEMRESVMAGQPMFSLLGDVARRSQAEALETVKAALFEQFKALGLDDKLALTIHRELRDSTGEKVKGLYWPGGGLIELALMGDPRQTLKHEAIHALRDLGLFRRAEWAALERAARADTKLWNEAKAAYASANLTEEQLVEEVIAEMFARWTPAQAAPTMFKRAMAKIEAFFRALRAAVTQSGYTNAEELMAAISRGEVGRRGAPIEWLDQPGPMGLAPELMAAPKEPVASRADQTNTAAFKEWFGKSKAVDDDGKPQVVYHGTPQTNIQKFKVEDSQSLRWGGKEISLTPFYFTDNSDVAETYGENVMETYLSMQNPLEVDANGESWDDFMPFGTIVQAHIDGHDGVIIRDIADDASGAGDQSTVYVVFDPKQIKSATDNRGTFSRTDPRIRYSKLGSDRTVDPVAFANTLAEERLQAAKKGIGNGPGFVAEAREWLGHVASGFTRHYRALPNTGEFSDVHQQLRKLEAAPAASTGEIVRTLEKLVGDLNPAEYDLFTRKVILDDLAWEVTQDHDLPFGLSEADIPRELAKIDAALAKRPDLQDRIRQRKLIMLDVADRMVAAGVLTADRIKNPAYYRHQVLDYARAAVKSGVSGKLEKPRWAKRMGSTKDINANLLEAEFDWLHKALVDIETAKTIDWIKRSPLNIRGDVLAAAKAHNQGLISRAIADDIRDNGYTLKSGRVTSPLNEVFVQFASSIAQGFDAVRGSIDNGYLDPIPAEYDAAARAVSSGARGEDVFPFLAWVAENPDPSIAGGAQQAFKAISQRKQFVRNLLGERYADTSDIDGLLRKGFGKDGYVTWQPEAGKLLYTQKTLPQHAMDKLLGQMAKAGNAEIAELLGLQTEREAADYLQNLADSIRAMAKDALVMAGQKYQIVIPEELAATLNSLRDPQADDLYKSALTVPMRLWKQWTLISPRRVIKYNLNNLSGDIDAVIAGNPRILRRLPQAVRELHAVMKGETPSARYKEAVARGVFDAGITVQEIPDISQLSQFEEIFNKADKGLVRRWTLAPIGKVWRALQDYTQFRENWLRYAAYLDYVERIEAGETMDKIGYGASSRELVDAVTDQKDRAALLARDLVGDYGGISAYGQDIRRTLVPFYSWWEVNFKRYVRLTANAYNQGIGNGLSQTARIGGAVGVKGLVVGVNTTAYLASRMFFVYVAIQMFNYLFHDDDEEKLDPSQRTQLHLTLGNIGGQVVTLRTQGALSDFLSWFGLQDAVATFGEIGKGRASWGDVLASIAKAPINKAWNGLTPVIQTPVTLLTGRKLFPDVFQPRTVRDRWRETAQVVGFEHEYDALAGKPSRGYGQSLLNAVAYTADPGEQAYNRLVGMAHDWENQKKGTSGGGGSFTSPRSVALYDWRRALRFQDEAAAKAAIERLNALGVKPKDRLRSLKSMHPLGNLTTGMRGGKRVGPSERAQFMATLSPEERTQLDEALKWYSEVFVGGAKASVED